MQDNIFLNAISSELQDCIDTLTAAQTAIDKGDIKDTTVVSQVTDVKNKLEILQPLMSTGLDWFLQQLSKGQ